jgi:hypothetical protein
MGLDMYLTAKRYLWKDEDKEIAKKINDLIEVDADQEKRFNGCSLVVKQIEIDAMYWRKANAIHGWFVENVQDDEDDCREYYVRREQLEELIAECVSALTSRKANKLPPKDGFFFGSTNIDEYYWQDLEDTVKGLERALTLPENQYEFYYSSSW